MAKKKKHPRPAASRIPAKTLPQPLLAGLGQAHMLIQAKRWDEARRLLDSLDQRYPNRVDVLEMLVNVNYALQDTRRYMYAAERLFKLEPSADLSLALAGAYLSNTLPMLALRAFRHFLDRWPDHPRSGEARRTIAGLEVTMAEVLGQYGMAGEDGIEVAVLHEESRSFLEGGDRAQARRTAEQLLRRRPTFVPALNNLSLIAAMDGHLTEAIMHTQRVLAIEPGNYHALANLIRFLCMTGRASEANPWIAQLKAVESNATDVWLKQAEALCFAGDDAGVLDAFSGAERAGLLTPPAGYPLLYHLAAVATMRLGRKDEARRLWRQALKDAPGLDLARENLDDLRKPVGEQHAPWPFTLADWITQKTLDDMVTQLMPAAQRGDERAIMQSTRRFVRRHPELTGLVPLLLDRGDPLARDFAFRLAVMAETPELLEALRGFALRQRGPDGLRERAAREVSRAGLLPQGPVRLWIKGKWRELLLMDFEIYDEPSHRHSKPVERLMIDGTEALRNNDPLKAERLLTQACELEPDAPDVLNNLAMAYELQGRRDEAHALAREIHIRHPDYFFGRIGAAQLAISEGHLAEARTLLESSLTQRRFHRSEFSALCRTQVDLALAEKNPDAAHTWVDLWASGDPDNPTLAVYQRKARLK